MTHSLVFTELMAAPSCAPQVGNPTPLWLQVIQAAGGIATTIGVLIALYIALIRDPKEASEEHQHHVAQLETIRRAKSERFAAQARKLVPSCVRTPLLGESWWIVRIDNASHAATTLRSVAVTAIDTNGFEVPGGCRRPHDTAAADESFTWSIREVLSESLESAKERPFDGVVMQAIKDAVAVHFVDEWPRTLPPNQHAVMSFLTAEPNYLLRITIDYEDEAGFQWRRTDTDPPRRIDETFSLNPVAAKESL